MANTVIITGSAGLIGSEATRFFAAKGFKVIGIDNDMRSKFFGPSASTFLVRDALVNLKNYTHEEVDIRDQWQINRIVSTHGTDIRAVIHCAAQPSHDWAARDPHADFSINAVGTLNLLEACRQFAPTAAFVHMSTNKVYGDNPNRWTATEGETRYDVPQLPNGFDESLSLDHCTHSIFGVSKASADLMAQEYGRYFGMNVGVFRGGCLTGPAHAGAKLHGFLSYLVKCAVYDLEYTVIGYHGKQVRDNIHSADLVSAFWQFVQAPRPGAVYNIGGGRERSCSVIEAIRLVEKVTGKRIQTAYEDRPRVGDHKWWISDTRKFERDYPNWKQRYTLEETVAEMVQAAA